MAYEMPTDSILEVIIHGQLAGQHTMTILHYRNDTTYSDGREAISTFLAAIDINNGGLMFYLAAATSSEMTYTSITGQMIFPTRYVKTVRTPPANDVGTVNSPALPPSTSVAIIKRGEQANKHGNGTQKMPGVAIDQVTDGVLSAGGLTAWQQFAKELDNKITVLTGYFTPVIFNKADPHGSQPVFEGEVIPQVRTMKRRVVGRGI